MGAGKPGQMCPSAFKLEAHRHQVGTVVHHVRLQGSRGSLERCVHPEPVNRPNLESGSCSCHSVKGPDEVILDHLGGS